MNSWHTPEAISVMCGVMKETRLVDQLRRKSKSGIKIQAYTKEGHFVQELEVLVVLQWGQHYESSIRRPRRAFSVL